MAMRGSWSLTVVFLCGLSVAACGARPDAPLPADAAAPPCWSPQAEAMEGVASATQPWTAVGEVPQSPQGRSEGVVLEAPAGSASVTLRVFDPTGAPACVQLSSLVDATGVDWVAPPEPGPYCLGCQQRVSLGVGYGLFVLPSNDLPLPLTTSLRVAAAALACPHKEAAAVPPTRLRIEARFAPDQTVRAPGRLVLRLVFARTSPLADETRRAEVVPEAIRLVNQMFAPGGLDVVVEANRVLDVADPLDLRRGDNGPLEDLTRKFRDTTGCSATAGDRSEAGFIPIVFAGCLRITDPDLQTTYQPDGLTPGIPSGLAPAGRADGVYIKGRSCRPGTPVIDWPPSLLAKLIAHELGHYLGLYHSVEPDGTLDQLADTDANNLMFASPLSATAQGFSAAQFRVMRRHPVVQF